MNIVLCEDDHILPQRALTVSGPPMGLWAYRECYSYSYSHSTRRVRSNACRKAYALKVADVDRQQKYPSVLLDSRAAWGARVGSP